MTGRTGPEAGDGRDWEWLPVAREVSDEDMEAASEALAEAMGGSAEAAPTWRDDLLRTVPLGRAIALAVSALGDARVRVVPGGCERRARLALMEADPEIKAAVCLSSGGARDTLLSIVCEQALIDAARARPS